MLNVDIISLKCEILDCYCFFYTVASLSIHISNNDNTKYKQNDDAHMVFPFKEQVLNKIKIQIAIMFFDWEVYSVHQTLFIGKMNFSFFYFYL